MNTAEPTNLEFRLMVAINRASMAGYPKLAEALLKMLLSIQGGKP